MNWMFSPARAKKDNLVSNFESSRVMGGKGRGQTKTQGETDAAGASVYPSLKWGRRNLKVNLYRALRIVPGP